MCVDRHHVLVAGCRHEDVGARRGIVHRHDFVAFHRGLQRADRIDFGDQYAAAGVPQRGGRTFADVAEAGDERDLAGHHHVGATANAVDEALAAAIEIVELRLGDGIVDVDGREQQRALFLHLIEAMHAGRRLFRNALDALRKSREPAFRLLLQCFLEQREENFFLFRACLVEKAGVAVLGAQSEMHEQRRIAAVVEDQIRQAAVAPLEELAGVIPVVDQALALPGEDRDAGGGDRRCGVVLRRINVARHPAYVGAERGERLDQHGRLDGHVQRTGDAGALERLLGSVFGTRRHQARHLGLGDGDFFPAPLRQSEILDDVVGELGAHVCS